MSVSPPSPADGAEPAPRRMARWRGALSLMRPAHWLKNIFVLVGLIYGHGWRDGAQASLIALVFIAFCLAASSVYCFNDAIDAEADRFHARKARRPVANGSLGARAAFILAAILAACGLAVAGAAGWRALAVIGFYLLLNLAYSLVLKRIALVDVACIAAGFVARLVGGTWAVGIAPSSWLLACGLLFTLYLGLGKRRAELADALDDDGRVTAARAALAGYSLPKLDWALTLTGALSLLAYGAYTLSDEALAAQGSRWLMLTVPFAALALGRYSYLIHRRRGGDDPAAALLADPPLAAFCFGFAAATLIILI